MKIFELTTKPASHVKKTLSDHCKIGLGKTAIQCPKVQNENLRKKSNRQRLQSNEECIKIVPVFTTLMKLNLSNNYFEN